MTTSVPLQPKSAKAAKDGRRAMVLFIGGEEERVSYCILH